MKRAWLITAFDPFAGRPQNNSQTVLQEIEKLATANANDPAWNFDFYFHVLPTEYDHCFTALMDHVAVLEKQGIKLEGILSLGEGAEEFKIETQANNLDDVPNFPDNKGVVRVEKRIFPKLKDDFIPLRFPFEGFTRIRTSKSPGFYICNHLCARMGVEYADSSKPFFGFIHVPRTGMGGIFTADVCAAMIVNGFRKI